MKTFRAFLVLTAAAAVLFLVTPARADFGSSAAAARAALKNPTYTAVVRALRMVLDSTIYDRPNAFQLHWLRTWARDLTLRLAELGTTPGVCRKLDPNFGAVRIGARQMVEKKKKSEKENERGDQIKMLRGEEPVAVKEETERGVVKGPGGSVARFGTEDENNCMGKRDSGGISWQSYCLSCVENACLSNEATCRCYRTLYGGGIFTWHWIATRARQDCLFQSNYCEQKRLANIAYNTRGC